MKRYLDLVPISAKVHRKQSRMSIFCIILAVFLVTTIFGMADMFIRSQILQTKIENGSFHIGIRDITDEQVMLISKRPDIKAAARYGVINYRGDQEYLLSGKNAIIAGCDKQWVTEMLVDFIIQGDFPQTDKQAMITESAKQMLNLQIGDEITIDGPDKTKISYTISGFCKNASKTMSEDSYGLFITTDAFRNIYWDIKSDNLSDYNSMLYIEFKNEFQVQNEIRNLKDQCKLSDEQISENTKLLGLIGQSTNSLMLQVYVAAGILFLLVMFAGIMMITSSLNSNIAQRTEFFGLMRCIGATPKQIMRMVRKEALRWCRFAIPVGILIGILVIWILCTILRFLSPEYFMAMPIFSISVPSIVAGIVLGLLTVLLASRSPAKKAAKVSPLSAVSGNTSSLMTTKKAINTKLFKVDTALGIHHAKASRKNLFLMTISFALSIILFLSFSVTIESVSYTHLTETNDSDIQSNNYSSVINSSNVSSMVDNVQSIPDISSQDTQNYNSNGNNTISNNNTEIYTSESESESVSTYTSSNLDSEQSSDISNQDNIINESSIIPENSSNPPEIIKININTATYDELVKTLPISDLACERIIEYRQLNGPFESIDELLNIEGIGKGALESIRELITV